MTYKPGDIIINKYRIEELIGRGAFAEVYRATHIELDRPRALKVLRKDAPGIGRATYLDYEQRFRLEARLGDQLDHPNLVQVYDFDRDGDDLVLVMEYAPGGSLAVKMRLFRDLGKQYDIEESLKIAHDIAAGMGALHDLDAVHRDLKPSNILFDNRERAKIADFGLVQISGGPSLRSQLSRPHRHPGTPGYMSPEQENSGAYLRPSSDVYSLGLIMFEMLTGRIYLNQRSGTRVSDLRGDASFWLDELISQVLSPNPNERPWNGKEVERLLSQVQELEMAAQEIEIFQIDKQTDLGVRHQTKERKSQESHQINKEKNIIQKQTLSILRKKKSGQVNLFEEEFDEIGKYEGVNNKDLPEKRYLKKVDVKRQTQTEYERMAPNIGGQEIKTLKVIFQKIWKQGKSVFNIFNIKKQNENQSPEQDIQIQTACALINVVEKKWFDRFGFADSIQNLLKIIRNGAKNIFKIKQPSPRIYRSLISFILFFVVVITIFTESQTAPPPPQEAIPIEVIRTSELINSLTSQDAVLIAFDYEPGMAGEMEAAAAAVVDHLMIKGAYLSLISTSPTGPALAERFIRENQKEHNYTSGIQYINLGFIPGGAAGLLGFVQMPQRISPLSFDGMDAWSTAPLNGIYTLADFKLVVMISDNPDSARTWIEQVQPKLHDTPLIAVVSAQAEPILKPYSGGKNAQIQGMVGGIIGGVAYEQMTGKPNLAREYWDALNFALITAIGIILFGGLFNFFASR
jgi:serine/threonine protein kinase